MTPALAALAAGLLALPAGWVAVCTLHTVGYRRPDDQPAHPQPGPRWWVLAVTVTAAASVAAAAAAHPHPALFLSAAPLIATGGWLAAVDLDVMRLPNRVLAATAALSVVAALMAAGWLHAPQILASGLLGTVVAGGLFAALHWVTRGGIGMGDVKLAALLGWIITPIGLTLLMPALFIGSVAAWVWNTLHRNHGPLPYGPWLLLGGWAGLLLTMVLGVA